MSLNLGPASSRFHNGRQATDEGGRLIRRKKSQPILSPLVGLIRHPLGTLASAIKHYNDPTIAAAEAAAAHRQALYLRLENATTFADWKAVATELDLLEGNEAWKEAEESHEYDYALVAAQVKGLEEARVSCDVERLLFLVRTSLTRGLGHMGQLRLYKHSHIGTKRLIERYIDSVQQTIAVLIDVAKRQGAECPIHPVELLRQLNDTRQAFGRTALLLSGGGTFGMNHIGVIKALWEARLLPRIVSGASAGSIVGAVLCVKTDAEIPQVLEEFCYGNLNVFGESESLVGLLTRLLKDRALFNIVYLKEVMRELLGEITFQEAYNRTRRILNIPVSSSSVHGLPRLLNFLTAPNVLIWSAVCTSCSVPLVYTESTLEAKDPRTGQNVPWDIPETTWIDGSVDNDLPMVRLAEMFNVNHFIVSQVNPHVVPFLDKEEQMVADQVDGHWAIGSAFAADAAILAKEEIVYRLQQSAERGILPHWTTKISSILNQQYSGDVNIFPKIAYADFPRVLSNPTQEYMLGCMVTGQRATWPKLSRIQNHVAIEQAIQRAHLEATEWATFGDSHPIRRLQSAGELSGHNRSKSLHEMSLCDPITTPSSPVLSKTAPTSPSMSRRRAVQFSCGPDEDVDSPAQPRRTSFSHLLRDDDSAASAAISDHDYFASSSSGPDDDSEPSSPITTTNRLSTITSAPSPLVSPKTTDQTVSTASTRERRAFLLANLAMTPATAETPATTTSTAIPPPAPASAMPTLPSSPERRYKSRFHPPGPVAPDPNEGSAPSSSSDRDARPVPQIRLPRVKGASRLASPTSPDKGSSRGGEEMAGLGLGFFL
ncbi:hypothetical protein IAQ61_009678 [Plenodomus lingam]|uniref:Patatin-like phospholipase domain-containing protein n=1 Tax=Leptosphaeria maculans (strain JN3 / isolate v23.1.3 / race Av1-4-5-6-7-8) TaxID=985895 RepID=E4ZT49_LEPMJ|nr:similar to triacylglycerol lipase [Plenodomus lingam JN3]KAH9863400.1 hypothetical protein IAQ61_009678 [Plenodomus lingam]CBX94480.1 similar to triacylglycerol lipase [Plenodomus lingam JN3]